MTPPRCWGGHKCRFYELERHENDDRIRTWERCEDCERERHGTYAKRLNDAGEEQWGRVGYWIYSL